MYETFDHTADLGLRIRADTLDALFEEAAQALFSVIVTDPATVQPTVRRDVSLPADDREFLLFDWLKQLLYWWDTEHLLFGKFQVKCEVQPSDPALRTSHVAISAQAWGEPRDRQRHQLEHEVKAITYHGLRVEKTHTGWLAEVIVDI